MNATVLKNVTANTTLNATANVTANTTLNTTSKINSTKFEQEFIDTDENDLEEEQVEKKPVALQQKVISNLSTLDKIQRNLNETSKALEKHEKHATELREIVQTQKGLAKKELSKVLKKSEAHIADLKNQFEEGNKIYSLKLQEAGVAPKPVQKVMTVAQITKSVNVTANITKNVTKSVATNSTANISKEANVTVAIKEAVKKPEAVKANKTVAIEANKTQEAKEEVITTKKAVLADKEVKLQVSE